MQKRCVISVKGPATIMQEGKPHTVMQEHVLVFELDQTLDEVLDFVRSKKTHNCMLVFETEVAEPSRPTVVPGPGSVISPD